MQSLPSYELRTKYEDDKPWIWCIQRKKWLVWQPEEAVRQQLLHVLIYEKGISPALVAVEREIKFHQLKKRFDVLVFDQQGTPSIICECKAPSVALNQSTVDQISRYNQVLQAPHLILFNGGVWKFYQLDEEGRFILNPSGWMVD